MLNVSYTFYIYMLHDATCMPHDAIMLWVCSSLLQEGPSMLLKMAENLNADNLEQLKSVYDYRCVVAGMGKRCLLLCMGVCVPTILNLCENRA